MIGAGSRETDQYPENEIVSEHESLEEEVAAIVTPQPKKLDYVPVVEEEIASNPPQTAPGGRGQISPDPVTMIGVKDGLRIENTTPKQTVYKDHRTVLLGAQLEKARQETKYWKNIAMTIQVADRPRPLVIEPVKHEPTSPTLVTETISDTRTNLPHWMEDPTILRAAIVSLMMAICFGAITTGLLKVGYVMKQRCLACQRADDHDVESNH